LERTDRRNYPVSAVREALLNAIVHRDYGLSASTLFNILDDHLEIVSIAGLFKT
jgi:ATP-dependent DNA helicase RecG